MEKKVRKIAVLVSGEGTTLQAIIDAIESGDLSIEIIISNIKCSTLECAKAAGINTWEILDAKSSAEWNERLYAVLYLNNVDLVLSIGYFKIGTKILDNYDVLEVVLYPVSPESVFTPYLYSQKPIIWKAPVLIHENDTMKDIAKHAQDTEKEQVLSILEALSKGKIDF